MLGLAHICRLSIDKVCDGINNIYFLVVVFIFHRKFYNLLKSVPSQNINDFTVFICYLPFTIFKRLFYLRGSKRKGGWSEPLENSNLLNSLSKFTEDVSDPSDTPSPSEQKQFFPPSPREKIFLICAYIILDQGISNGHSKPYTGTTLVIQNLTQDPHYCTCNIGIYLLKNLHFTY